MKKNGKRNLLLAGLLALSALVISSSCIKGYVPIPPPKTFVLVHGAWQAPYGWDSVKTLLTAAGQRVVVVQLPGHGTDFTDPATISMDTYRDAIVAAINGVSGKVILVGHSLSGMPVTAANEVVPGKIEKLVYITCFLPSPGQTVLSLASSPANATALLGPSLIFPASDTAAPPVLDIIRANLVSIFIQDGTPAEQQLVVAKFRPEPLLPFLDTIHLTANFTRADKYYIHTLQDHVIAPALQNQMVATAGITQIYSINSSHCPFLSRADSLTAILLKIAGR